jgi:hypothetical protein
MEIILDEELKDDGDGDEESKEEAKNEKDTNSIM